MNSQRTIPPRSNEDTRKAALLRQALSFYFRGHFLRGASVAEIEARGVEEYRRAFGQTISVRHWRRLLNRTLDRDAGRNEWDRIELYFSDRPAPDKPSPPQAPAEQSSSIVQDMREAVALIRDPNSPSASDKEYIWRRAFQWHEDLFGSGMADKAAWKVVLDALWVAAPFLAASRNSLCHGLNARRKRYVAGGGNFNELRDKREENAGNTFELPEEDRLKLLHRAGFNYGGRLAPAWQELMAYGELSPETTARYAGKTKSKSRVPDAVANAIAQDAKIMAIYNRGPRAVEQISPHVTRDYSKLRTYQCVSGDDVTWPVYFTLPGADGRPVITRGQCLVFIDARSLEVCVILMIPRRQYTAVEIRSCCLRVFENWCVPDVFQFERGIWERSKAVKGEKVCPFDHPEIETGLQRHGIKFIHSIRARSKTVERVLGILQDKMEGEPGYCGRDERKDAPESLRRQMAAVKAGVDPSKFFYSFEQWKARLEEIIDQYNRTPQEGHILQGLSPAQATEMFCDRDNPPRRLTADIRRLFTHECVPRRVSTKGFTVSASGRNLRFYGKGLDPYIGRDVMVWIDYEVLGGENPSVIVTDMDKNPDSAVLVTAEKSPDFMAQPEQLGQALSKAKSHMQTHKALFLSIKKRFEPLARPNVVDPVNRALNTKMGELRSGEARRAKTVERVNRRAARVGLTVPEDLAAEKGFENRMEKLATFLENHPGEEQ